MLREGYNLDAAFYDYLDQAITKGEAYFRWFYGIAIDANCFAVRLDRVV